jgi:hypothetical protein
MHEVDSTIQSIEQKLETLNKIYRYIKDEKKTVNKSIFTILGKGLHENTISDYLAYVLHPQLNGIGITPLQYVLDLLHSGIVLNEDDSIKIHREYTLRNNRRIDFLITINEDIVIGIEHKVFSEEHGDQTNDYAQLIEKEFTDSGYSSYYLFLTPSGKAALSDQFIAISYKQLVSALRKVTVDYIEDIRKAVLFNEFLFHLEGQFMKNETIALSNKAMLFKDNYELFHDLQKEFLADYQTIFKYIESVITNYFKSDIGGDWEFDFKEDRGYHKMAKKSWKTSGIDIHFELGMSTTSLISQQMTFMLDIEGSNKKQFSEKYDSILKQSLETDKGVKYRSAKRKDTFAHKSYPILTVDQLNDETHFREKIVEIIHDFKSLIRPVDEVIAEFTKVK